MRLPTDPFENLRVIHKIFLAKAARYMEHVKLRGFVKLSVSYQAEAFFIPNWIRGLGKVLGRPRSNVR
jgi:hypothetical protein